MTSRYRAERKDRTMAEPHEFADLYKGGYVVYDDKANRVIAITIDLGSAHALMAALRSINSDIDER